MVPCSQPSVSLTLGTGMYRRCYQLESVGKLHRASITDRKGMCEGSTFTFQCCFKLIWNDTARLVPAQDARCCSRCLSSPLNWHIDLQMKPSTRDTRDHLWSRKWLRWQMHEPQSTLGGKQRAQKQEHAHCIGCLFLDQAVCTVINNPLDPN